MEPMWAINIMSKSNNYGLVDIKSQIVDLLTYMTTQFI